jgi:hypothetical protein
MNGTAGTITTCLRQIAFPSQRPDRQSGIAMTRMEELVRLLYHRAIHTRFDRALNNRINDFQM